MATKNTLTEPGKNKAELVLAAALVLTGLFSFAIYISQFLSYTMDDAFISLRYARNFANGFGMVFNPNEYPRAEGITSPLYALLLSIPFKFGFDGLVFSKIIGILSTLLSALVIFVITSHLAHLTTSVSKNKISIMASLGVLCFLSDPYVTGNAVSGMETALSALICLLFVLYFVKVFTLNPDIQGRNLSGKLASLGLLASLFRPEMTLFVISMMVLAWVFIPQKRRMLQIELICFGGLGMLYFVSRFAYFGLLLPLPFYVKQGGIGLHGLRDTFSYAIHILFILPLIGVFGLWLAKSYRKNAEIFWALPAILFAAVVIQGAYYLTIYHVMGMGFRFFQPIHALVVILAGLALANIWQVFQKPGLLRIMAALLMAGFVATNIYSFSSARIIYKDLNAKAVLQAIRVGQALKTASQGQPFVIALNDCGAVPFYTDFKTIDLAGLTNRNIATDRSVAGALKEVVNEKVDIVMLVAGSKHGLADLKGYEGLSSEQILGLGYGYIGSLQLNKTYFWLVFGKNTALVADFTKRLSDIKVLELDPQP